MNARQRRTLRRASPKALALILKKFLEEHDASGTEADFSSIPRMAHKYIPLPENGIRPLYDINSIREYVKRTLTNPDE